MHRLCYRASSHIASTVRRSEILDRTNRLYTASFSTRVRRRRRTSTRVATQTNNDEETELRMISQANDMVEKTNNFIARDKDGNEIPMDEYLKFASLSPWVPCPDPVALRALDIAKVGPNDVHYELGSGDGRLNFHAIDPSYGVKKSVGVDIDPALVQRCEQRKMKIHPAPKNLEFICADLTDAKDSTTASLWKTIQLECTVMTMYFVEDALLKVKPLIEKNLLGSNCKIVTIGYPIKGWEPVWAEVILGLTVHLYDMKNLDSLYNESKNVDVSGLEEEQQLNLASKKKIAELEKEEGHNPFEDQMPAPSIIENTGEDDDNYWDFDEYVEYDNDNNVVQTNNTSDRKKK